MALGLLLALSNRLVQHDIRRSPGGRWVERNIRGAQADASGRNPTVISLGLGAFALGAVVVLAALVRG